MLCLSGFGLDSRWVPLTYFWFLQIWVVIYVYGTMINWSTLIKKLMQTYIVIVSGSFLNVSTVHLNGIWHLIWRCLLKPVLGGHPVTLQHSPRVSAYDRFHCKSFQQQRKMICRKFGWPSIKVLQIKVRRLKLFGCSLKFLANVQCTSTRKRGV